MLRISATEVEDYRLYRRERWLKHSQLVSRLRGERTESIEMAAGTALHAFLESRAVGDETLWDGDEFISGNFAFFWEGGDGEVVLPPGREIKTERVFQVLGIPVTLVGKADTFDGWRVSDHKLTAECDADRYLESLQWRIYLMLFGAQVFRYNVFEGHEIKLKGRQRRADRKSVWEVTGVHSFTACRYLGMESQVMDWLTGLVGFIREHVPERINHPDAFEKQLPF